MRYVLIVIVCLVSCSPNKEKPLFVNEELAFNIYKECRIAEIALESYPPLERDSIRKLLLNEIGEVHNIPVSDIENLLIGIQSQPVMHKRFIDNLYKHVDTVVKKKLELENEN